ncbi:inositol-pentakisphosphate 2-kinase-like [Ornithodoros turicata]|uniref:inositol-pentakisphosphate 2-kinase-like n=1 Tax=Ornithodoros turicata TaxID=34597 RepID=UPI0031391C2F
MAAVGAANVWQSEETKEIPLISPENCKFRGEGNSSLVVTLRNEERVLRLRKSSTYKEELSNSTEKKVKKCQLQADFISRVMRKLLGYRFVRPPILVPLTVEDVRIINKCVQHDRPLHRMKKGVLEVPTLGLLLPDYCMLPNHLRKYAEGPVLSVEIKPKQGFLPSSHALPRDHQIKASVCRFHLSQNYKNSKGIISSMSMYCPLDLFSGCPLRMHHALRELLYHPQNNLRIFKNKELIFSEEMQSGLNASLGDFFEKCDLVSREEQLCQLVGKSLRHSFPTVDKESLPRTATPDVGAQSCVRSSICTCSYQKRSQHRLPKGSVLERVLQLQCLCSMDITEVYPLYDNIKKALGCDSDDLSVPHYLQDGYPCPTLPKALGKPQQQVFESDLEFACRKIWEFLVALTARDCSIMLSLQRLSPLADIPQKDCIVEDAYGQLYLFSFGIVDLDPKAANKLEKVYYDDSNMVNLLP